MGDVHIQIDDSGAAGRIIVAAARSIRGRVTLRSLREAVETQQGSAPDKREALRRIDDAERATRRVRR